VPCKWVLPLKWVPQAPRIWERDGRPRIQNRPKQTTIGPGRRASVDGSGRLPTGRQTESYSAKSGYNKGTIRSDIRYLAVSKDVRRHRLISSDYITTLPCHAEVASSSLVVPAITFNHLQALIQTDQGIISCASSWTSVENQEKQRRSETKKAA
jgi:hypothetical protein